MGDRRYPGGRDRGMKSFIPLIIMLLPFWAEAQKEVTLGGMTLSYRLLAEEIELQLTAPTTGWVGVGFNSRNSIVKSDLYLLRVKEGKVEGLDLYVVGAGNPREDTELGGTNSLILLEGLEKNSTTQVNLRLPFPSGDKFDYLHHQDKEFWLILAYSVSDDFDHHSIMRKHTLFSFSE